MCPGAEVDGCTNLPWQHWQHLHVADGPASPANSVVSNCATPNPSVLKRKEKIERKQKQKQKTTQPKPLLIILIQFKVSVGSVFETTPQPHHALSLNFSSIPVRSSSFSLPTSLVIRRLSSRPISVRYTTEHSRLLAVAVGIAWYYLVLFTSSCVLHEQPQAWTGNRCDVLSPHRQVSKNNTTHDG